MSREPFYVQGGPREPWHIESDEDPEEMLCEKRVSVESDLARIREEWGIRKCFACWAARRRREAVR